MLANQTFTHESANQQENTPPAWWEMLVEGGYGKPRVRRGDCFESTILAFGDRSISVAVDGKRDGIVQARDLENVPETYLEQLEVGDRIPVRVIKAPLRDNSVIVSLKQGLEQEDWIRAERMLEDPKPFKAKVTGTNRGGVLVQFGRLQGFVPNSHLLRVPRGTREEHRRLLKQDLIGTTISVILIDADIKRRRLVLSERKAASNSRGELLQELHEGAIRTGVVSNLVDFGAFVDLGGMDGLLHISEISWEHIDHPGSVLSVGEKVEVYVLAVDRERERISLSRKRLIPDPWSQVTEKLRSGDIVAGTLTHTTSFGAFVDIGGGVEGLIHVSEMPDSEETLAALVPNTQVKVQVLRIDPIRHRISLHLEAAPQSEDESTPASGNDTVTTRTEPAADKAE